MTLFRTSVTSLKVWRWVASLPDFRPPIGEALALDAFQGLVHALHVLDTKGSALVVAEIELRQIALQVGRANMVVGAIDAALEQGEVALNGVGVGVAAHVLVNAVKIGRAHVCTPVTNAHLVCRLLLEKKKNRNH